MRFEPKPKPKLCLHTEARGGQQHLGLAAKIPIRRSVFFVTCRLHHHSLTHSHLGRRPTILTLPTVIQDVVSKEELAWFILYTCARRGLTGPTPWRWWCRTCG